MTVNMRKALINFPKYFCNVRNYSIQFHIINLNKMCDFSRKCQKLLKKRVTIEGNKEQSCS